MKSIMIAFDQAHQDVIINILQHSLVRGYTEFPITQGKGSFTGDPHLGSHAWPSMCSTIITIVDDDRVEPVLKRLKNLDNMYPDLGLRAFVWNIEQTI